MSPDALASMALRLAVDYDASITSWRRTPRHNAAVGGAPASKHLSGHAVDLVLDDPSRTAALLAEARAAGLVAIPESDHIHLSAPVDA